MTKDIPGLKRFWKKVEIQSNSCWLWKGTRFKKSYGMFWLNGTMRGAHRAIFLLMGKTIPKGMVVMHLCDNKICVNPKHLKIGTSSDNNRDTVLKGRRNNKAPQGENHVRAKLSMAQVKQIRKDDRTCRFLGRLYEVNHKTIWNIKNNKSWRTALC